MKSTISQSVRKNLGYTIDQTILIVAVIAVLITLIIGSVGWDLLSRAGGTKLASHLGQIEDANSSFYAKMGVWPHDAMAQAGIAARRNDTGNILVLKDRDATFANSGQAARFFTRFQDYLPGFTVDNTATPTAVEHTYGNGGEIAQVENTAQCPGNSTFLRITMTNVPVQEILEADKNIDNSDGAAAGRLTWGDADPFVAGDANSDGAVTLAYCANNVGF